MHALLSFVVVCNHSRVSALYFLGLGELDQLGVERTNFIATFAHTHTQYLFSNTIKHKKIASTQQNCNAL